MTAPNPIVSGIRRAEQVLYEQVGEKTTLEYGIAFFDVEYPHSLEDNAFREVLIQDPAQVPRAWAEAQAFYDDRSLDCHRWVPSMAQDAADLAPVLSEQGFREQRYNAMYVARWPDLPLNERVRVLPARAMKQAFRALHTDERTADIEQRRMDYAQFDVYVAILDGVPAGLCGLLQAGEIANIRKLAVAEPFRRRKVGSTLLHHVLELARRLMLRVVCLKVESDNDAGLAFLQRCGFEHQGHLVEFHRG